MSKELTAGIVRKWLEEQKWHFREKTHADGVVVFRTSVSSDCEAFNGFDISVICRDKDVQSIFYPPVRATAKRFAAVAEYMTRVNYRFRIGKMTMDYRDGEIRWEIVKSQADLIADRDDAMDDLIGFSGFVMDKFMPGMVAVLMGFKKPADAFADCDRSSGEGGSEDGGSEASEVICGGVESQNAANAGVESLPEECGKVASRRGRKVRKPVKTEPQQKKDAKSPEDSRNGSANSMLPDGYSLKGLNIDGRIPLEKIVDAVKKFREEKCADVDAQSLNILLS